MVTGSVAFTVLLETPDSLIINKQIVEIILEEQTAANFVKTASKITDYQLTLRSVKIIISLGFFVKIQPVNSRFTTVPLDNITNKTRLLIDKQVGFQVLDSVDVTD